MIRRDQWIPPPNPWFKLAAFERKINRTNGQRNHLALGTHKGSRRQRLWPRLCVGAIALCPPPPDFSQDTTEIPSLPSLLSPNKEAHKGDIADDTGVADAPFPPVEGGGQLFLPTAMVSPLRPLDIVEVMPPGPCD